MHNCQVTELTLLSWVNTFPLDNEVESIADLADGVVFSKMMENISSDYAVPDLEQNTGPSKWLSNKKSLEAVNKSLLRYIGDNCPNLDSVAFESRVDLNAIAEHGDRRETIKLLTIFLMAAVEGPHNRDYIGLITTKLDTSAQEEIKGIIMQANSIVQQTATPNVVSVTTTKDHELAREEAQANLFAEHEALKKKYADFMTRFERLTISHEELIQHSNIADARLNSLQESNDDDRTNYIRKQMERIRELEDIIAHQEQQLEADRAIKETQYRELATLRPLAATLTECKDELKEVKIENLSLVKKANKVDHYLKKLENHALLQRENSELREKVDLLEDNQRDYDRVHEENAKYRTTATEYGSRFQEQELHIVEISSQKNALKQEIQILNQKIAELNERQHHDEKFINELQEQMRISSGPLSQELSAPGQHSLSLEEELERVEDTPDHAIEISRLKSEIKFLQKSGSSAKIAQLNIDLAESNRAKKQLEDRFQELTEKYTAGQQQSNAIASNSSSEKNESLVKTRQMYLEVCQELTAVKVQLAQLQSESSQRDGKISEEISNFAAVAAVQGLKRDDIKSPIMPNQIPVSSLHADLLVLQDKYRTILGGSEIQMNQLVAALLSKEPQNFLKSLKEQTSGVGEHTKIAECDLSQNTSIQDQGQISANESLKQKSSKVHSSDINEQKDLYESKIKNLSRENALMATAWYDLMSRLQSNHLVLQRRQDTPKSWLNKQRQLVNSAGRR